MVDLRTLELRGIERYRWGIEVEGGGGYWRDCPDCEGSGSVEVEPDDPTCSACGGTGEYICPRCDGTGMATCPWCSGTGEEELLDGTRQTCRGCDGERVYVCAMCWGEGKHTCRVCDGTGQVETLSETCETCAGEGVVPPDLGLADWRIHEEHCGIEVDSPIQSTGTRAWAESVAGVRTAVEALIVEGFDWEGDNGTHVHVDASRLRKTGIVALMRLWLRVQDRVYEVFRVYPDRISEWCERLKRYHVDGYALYGELPDDRYYGLNLYALSKHGTIEFRFGNGFLHPSNYRGHFHGEYQLQMVRFCRTLMAAAEAVQKKELTVRAGAKLLFQLLDRIERSMCGAERALLRAA